MLLCKKGHRESFFFPAVFVNVVRLLSLLFHLLLFLVFAPFLPCSETEVKAGDNCKAAC